MVNDQETDDLDRVLSRAAPPPAVPPALERRVLADFSRISSRWTLTRLLDRLADAVWPDAPFWQPACALAAAVVVGLGVAAFAPLDVSPPDEGQTFAFDTQLPQDI
jgi:anti-sigma-K factor RskA